MDDEIKEYVDQAISIYGLDTIKEKTHDLLNQLKSFNSKDGIIDKIDMCKDIINYILSIERDNKLKLILGERKIYSFSEFNLIRFV